MALSSRFSSPLQFLIFDYILDSSSTQVLCFINSKTQLLTFYISEIKKLIYHNNWLLFPFSTGCIKRGAFYSQWLLRFDKIAHNMHITGCSDHSRKVVFTYICVLMVKY